MEGQRDSQQGVRERELGPALELELEWGEIPLKEEEMEEKDWMH